VRFDFNHKLTSQGTNLSQPIRRLKRFKLEKIIDQNVPPRKDTVHGSPIEAIQDVFLSRLKCKISPNDGTFGKQPLEKHVGTKMHMVMAVQTPRFCSIDMTELIELCLYDVVEITNKQGVKKYLSKPLTSQVRSKFA
jgi:hypothetical protein